MKRNELTFGAMGLPTVLTVPGAHMLKLYIKVYTLNMMCQSYSIKL